uniref:Uncharacterized protein n=1 Tax=Oryza barthii TaxID=65489 RepID=A0A0D3HQ06_9ORYZ
MGRGRAVRMAAAATRGSSISCAVPSSSDHQSAWKSGILVCIAPPDSEELHTRLLQLNICARDSQTNAGVLPQWLLLPPDEQSPEAVKKKALKVSSS